MQLGDKQGQSAATAERRAVARGARASKCPSPEEREAARRPLASLISKSEKAQQKLRPDSWQYAMLAENLKALRLANALLNESSSAAAAAQSELQHARLRLEGLCQKVAETERKFALGTAARTLQRNRLAALQTAVALVALGERELGA
ncbi:MAG: hypothetical protein H3C50_08915 [Kiritimatiellae bacterium]|nr:hypothetical protein [Kiritimatiellia bacterium]MCO5068293.1 hypothetical protein [Kiritimatiellia bacterium]